ncbi:MAG: hypothetical protein ACR2KV_00385 [Solirubrobacteraceae bacterium]
MTVKWFVDGYRGRGVKVVRYAGLGKVDLGISRSLRARSVAALGLSAGAARDLAAKLIEAADAIEADADQHRPQLEPDSDSPSTTTNAGGPT